MLQLFCYSWVHHKLCCTNCWCNFPTIFEQWQNISLFRFYDQLVRIWTVKYWTIPCCNMSYLYKPTGSDLIKELHLQQNSGVHAGGVGQTRDHNCSTVAVRKIQTFTHLEKQIQHCMHLLSWNILFNKKFQFVIFRDCYINIVLSHIILVANQS